MGDLIKAYVDVWSKDAHGQLQVNSAKLGDQGFDEIRTLWFRIHITSQTHQFFVQLHLQPSAQALGME